MLAVVQRVSRARVTAGGAELGAIGPGLLVLLGVAGSDGPEDSAYIARKLARLRIFEDDQGLMNRSLEEAGGAVLLVSQFTLLADTRRGNRPSFSGAAAPESAELLYQDVAGRLRHAGLTVATGEFGAMMQVELVNNGPVTIIINSREK